MALRRRERVAIAVAAVDVLAATLCAAAVGAAHSAFGASMGIFAAAASAAILVLRTPIRPRGLRRIRSRVAITQVLFAASTVAIGVRNDAPMLAAVGIAVSASVGLVSVLLALA